MSTKTRKIVIFTSILVLSYQTLNWNRMLMHDVLVRRGLRRIHKVNFRSTDAYTSIKRTLRSELDYQKETFCNERNIRFMVIGNDNNPINKGTPIYPSELCGATNEWLIRGGEPKDWSECFRARIGDGTRNDVFILDYFEVADDYLNKLVGRIRSRFPKSLIINLKHWYPFWTGYYDRALGGKWVDVSQWAMQNGYPTMSNDALHEFYYNTSLPWTTTSQYGVQQYFINEATKNNPRNMTWTLYKGREGDDGQVGLYTQDLLIRRAWMYDNWNVRNEYGDQDVALGIFQILEERDMMRNDTVNDWEGNDDNPSVCHT